MSQHFPSEVESKTVSALEHILSWLGMLGPFLKMGLWNWTPFPSQVCYTPTCYIFSSPSPALMLVPSWRMEPLGNVVSIVFQHGHSEENNIFIFELDMLKLAEIGSNLSASCFFSLTANDVDTHKIIVEH